jgi:hypothetical protein
MEEERQRTYGKAILSFAILTLLYLTFIRFLHTLGLVLYQLPDCLADDPESILLSLTRYILLWGSGAKIVTRDQHPKLHDLEERIVARNNMPKPN